MNKQIKDALKESPEYDEDVVFRVEAEPRWRLGWRSKQDSSGDWYREYDSDEEWLAYDGENGVIEWCKLPKGTWL